MVFSLFLNSTNINPTGGGAAAGQPPAISTTTLTNEFTISAAQDSYFTGDGNYVVGVRYKPPNALKKSAPWALPLSTAYDVSTSGSPSTGKYFDPGVFSRPFCMTGNFFDPSDSNYGKLFYVLHEDGEIAKWTTTTAFDFSTQTAHGQVGTHDMTTERPEFANFQNSGNTFIAVSNSILYTWSLASAYDLDITLNTSAAASTSNLRTLDSALEIGRITALQFVDNGNYCYIQKNLGSTFHDYTVLVDTSSYPNDFTRIVSDGTVVETSGYWETIFGSGRAPYGLGFQNTTIQAGDGKIGLLQTSDRLYSITF